MRKSRFTESQIVSILKDGDAGMPLAELVRKHGISRADVDRHIDQRLDLRLRSWSAGSGGCGSKRVSLGAGRLILLSSWVGRSI
jgi:hypothetical protein